MKSRRAIAALANSGEQWGRANSGVGSNYGGLGGFVVAHRIDRSRCGRPGERNVDSRPNRLAVVCCQADCPKGVPFDVLRRNALNSASVSAWFT